MDEEYEVELFFKRELDKSFSDFLSDLALLLNPAKVKNAQLKNNVQNVYFPFVKFVSRNQQ